MLTLITISFCLFVILLTGWTVTTYFIQKDSQQFIIKELRNLLNISTQFFISLKNLIIILTKHFPSSQSEETSSVEKQELDKDEELLSLVQPIQEIENQSFELTNEEDDDIAISSFSSQVIEVINEEEEKVA